MALNHYRLLGKSGLRVSPLALGTMTFGTDWGWGADVAESRRQLELYAERGGNFLDTANFYTEGTSETILGDLLTGQRDRFVLATKYTLSMGEGDPNAGGNHRKSLQQNLNASLKRLNTDYIDLLWVHMDDGITPLEETMRALDEVVRQGKVLYVGISDMPAWRVARANTLAEWRGWSPFVGLQIEYSLAERTPERDLIPMARELGLGVTPWSPLAQGVLSGRYAQADLDSHSPDLAPSTPSNGGTMEGRHERNKTNGRLSARTLASANEAKAIAGELGATTVQVALAWLLAQPGVVSPIVGARTVAQLEDSLGCFDVNLSPEHLARLDAVSKIELGFPHDFLRQEAVQKFVRGGTTIVG